MSETGLIITPKTKVGELLDNYPQLEATLLDLSPAFGKLKNPVLRKTVARIASLQQAAVVGGLKVEELVNRLRQEVGQDMTEEYSTEPGYLVAHHPEWFKEDKVSIKFDATPVINSGGSPMNDVLSLAHALKPDEIMELSTPFVPVPIIDMLRNKGFLTFSIQSETGIKTFFAR